MPLRDHFHPPVSSRHSWEGFHAAWPTMLVIRLAAQLPEGFLAEPRVHLGSDFEVDVAGFEDAADGGQAESSGTAFAAAPQPTRTVEVDLADEYEYEVLVFDQNRNRRLVGAVEFVSPANKDRPEHRRTFVSKCAALLHQGVCVVIVDPVTVRQFNLYADLLDMIGGSDPMVGSDPPPVYAVTCRGRKGRGRGLLDAWFYPLAVGHPLPGLPLWLTESTSVTLDLEDSYEDTCRVLRIS